MLGHLLIKLMVVLSSSFCILLPERNGVIGHEFKNYPQKYTVTNYVIIGDSLILSCELNLKNGVSWPPVTWRKNGAPLNDVSYRVQSFGSIQTTNDTLSLENVLLADSGKYTCIVGNGSKIMQRTFTLHVKEKGYSNKPQIRPLKPANLTAQVGSQVMFECEAYGSSLPYIQWIKHFIYVLYSTEADEQSENQTMESRPGIRRVKSMESMDEIEKTFKRQNLTMKRKENMIDIIQIKSIERRYKNRLIIDNVDFSDDAEYKCIAFNDVGYSVAVAYLHVIPAPTASKLDLALRYENKYGNDGGSLIVIPLTVIVIVPISFIVLLIISFAWWHERNKRNRSTDKVSLIPFTTMRRHELFDSEEHLPRHYPKIHRKRLSQIRCEQCISNADVDDVLLESHQRTSHHSIPISIHSISPQCPSHDSLDNYNGQPEADQHGLHDSDGELEWEPQELELKTHTAKRFHSSRSNQSL